MSEYTTSTPVCETKMTIAEQLRQVNMMLDVALQSLAAIRTIIYGDPLPELKEEKPLPPCMADEVLQMTGRAEILLKQIDIIRGGLC